MYLQFDQSPPSTRHVSYSIKPFGGFLAFDLNDTIDIIVLPQAKIYAKVIYGVTRISIVWRLLQSLLTRFALMFFLYLFFFFLSIAFDNMNE